MERRANRPISWATKEQMETLTKEVTELRRFQEQAGKQNERHSWMHSFQFPTIPWSSLLLGLLYLLMAGGALLAVWSSWEKLWSLLGPIFQS